MKSVIVIGCLTSLVPLVKYVRHRHLTLNVMVFVTYNQHTHLLLLTEQGTFTLFAMHSVVGKVNNTVYGKTFKRENFHHYKKNTFHWKNFAG